ncbi:unnamed protein product [Orchesella dallaii]|uniref:HECT domain-containing protein n=1 Tax=Orchesella dallaii TaxID=48710 RepID=A0ABP1R2B0_9HEXA
MPVYKEACKLFAMAYDFLYTSPQSRNDFFLELYDFLEQNDDQISSTRASLMMLEDAILSHFSESLNNHGLKYEEGVKWVVEAPWIMKIIQSSNTEIATTLGKMEENGFLAGEILHITSNLPMVSVSTSYIDSVVNFFLRCLVVHASELPMNVVDSAIEVFREVLKAGPIIVETCLEILSTVDTINLAIYNCTEAILKSSLLGHGICQILGLLSLETTGLRPILDELTEECIQLTVSLSFLADKLNPTNPLTSSENLGNDWASKIRLPSPWNNKRFHESPHPVRESFRAKETITIPEARQLLIKFSPQSATQYDYDRLIFHSATKKISEFGGNYFGYGNRFFSGPGWPRSLLKVDGNNLSYSFEMKSGREHNVPDKALYGFAFTIYPIFDCSDLQKPSRNDDVSDPDSLSPIAPGFTTMTALHCIDVIQNISRVLLQGAPPTQDEKKTNILLENRLVSFLKWPISKDLPPYERKFHSELLSKVKKAVGVPPLQMRLSIIEKMRASDLEELYFQCCLQHIGTNPYLNSETMVLGCESVWNSEPTRDIIREIFRNVDSMFRRIIAFYEMEKMLCQEIEEISNNTKEIGEAFFSDSTFLENPTEVQTLAWICYLEYDKDNPMNLINDVTAMVNALSADGSAPSLTRTDELIEETHLKCRYLLAATPDFSLQNVGFSYIFPTIKMTMERLHDVHSFISSHMFAQNANISSFIEARRSRRERAGDRIKGLDILHKVLECSSPTSALLIVSAILLQSGPRLKDIWCSGLEKEVIKIFGEVMRTAVGIAEKNPLLHRYTIALLSVTAYDRTDEENLVESGLVGLLDQLCAYQTGHLTPMFQLGNASSSSPSSSFPEAALTTQNKASTLAWAAFQVLASQCASWERSSSSSSSSPTKQRPSFALANYYYEGGSEWDEPEHRELPLQISMNVTNHLARAAALAALSSTQDDQLSSSSSPSSTSSCSPSLAVAIQDVLDLLNNLRSYKIGRAILKQGPCISRLLGLLQDSRLSPRLVLTILKLLHTALPLVDNLDAGNFKQIVIRNKISGFGTGGINSFWSIIESTPYTQVASMLLMKLADYLVSGSSFQSSIRLGNNETSKGHGGCQPATGTTNQGTMMGLIDPKFDKMEVWVHKSSDQTTSSLIRQLFVDTARQDLRPSRGSLNELEAEMGSNGKVLLYTEESSLAERKALRISQLGHLVTLLPVGFSRSASSYGGGNHSASLNASSRATADILCKDRNSELSSWDQTRPFLSGHVAENLASEIVQLITALLSSSSSSRKDGRGKESSGSRLSGRSSRGNVLTKTGSSSSISTAASDNISINNPDSTGSDNHLASTTSSQRTAWSGAVEQVISAALKLLPRLVSVQNPTIVHLEPYVYSARLVIATLTVLGGFTETIRPGLEVWLVDERKEELVEAIEANWDEWEYKATRAKVISVSETCPTAKVEVVGQKGQVKSNLAISDTLTVPISRLVPAHFQKTGVPNLPSLSRLAQTDLATFLKTLLVTTGNNLSKGATNGANGEKDFPLKKPLPTLSQIVSNANNGSNSSESRAIAQAMMIVRLMAEIRTKAMQVLHLWLKRKEFSDIFLGIGSESQFQRKFGSEVLEATENLKELSKACIPSHKTPSLETQVSMMRLLYRDCTKPPRLPLTTDKVTTEGLKWDMARPFPKIKNTVFSSVFNTLVYTGDYNVSGGHPRGLCLFGNGAIPPQGFYWEATIVSMEDLGQHADLMVVPPLSIGFSPSPSGTGPSSNDIWKYPSGTIMFQSLGRVIHFKTQDPGSWLTTRLDLDPETGFRVKAGDTIGIGWEKSSTSPPPSATGGGGPSSSARTATRALRTAARNPSVAVVTPTPIPDNTAIISMIRRGGRARSTNQVNVDNSPGGGSGNNSGLRARGNIFFTLNGRRLPNIVEQNNNSDLHPILHIQKRLMVVHTNLGEKPFLFAEANQKPGGAGTKAQGHQETTSIPVAIVRPHSSPGPQARVTSTDTGTSNADVLLRRVSDSLQDLNLVFNIHLSELDSEQELNIQHYSGSGSNSTVSDHDHSRDGIEVMEWQDANAVVAIAVVEDNEGDVDDDGGITDDEDDNDLEEDIDSNVSALSEPNIGGRGGGARRRAQRGARGVLPPSPISGASASGSSVTVRIAHLPPAPAPTERPPTRRGSGGKIGSGGGGGGRATNSLTTLMGGGTTHSSSKRNEIIGKGKQKVSEYNPTKCLDYFMGGSPTTSVKVFQGPRRYVCSCSGHIPTPLDYLLLDKNQQLQDERRGSDLDSLDGFEDEEDDDIHSLLVRAWETQVFPTIRRRFRNESERRDGLEQIRGALQLGMIEIARQTVEFLYEEGGGVPRDLHFPTLDEIRAEAVKCTVDKVKAGMSVVIRPLQDQMSSNDNSNSVLPAYAVTGMLRSFGLVGEVLEVDLTHDLVLVETYIESEGVLVRFWYPVSSLDKTQSGKKPTLSTNTVNMFKLHSNLISMESSLCHLYSRACYLSIAQHCTKNIFLFEHDSIVENERLRASSIAAQIAHDFDFESVQILSDQLLANYPPTRDLFTFNLQCESPSLKFLTDCGNPSVLFYKDHDHLSKSLRYKIREASTDKETPDSVDDLTAKFLNILQLPEKFPNHELPIDRITDFEISLPNSAFTLISFKGPQSPKFMTNLDNTIHPCLHVSSYDSSEICRHLMACYPLEPLSSVMHRSATSEGGGAQVISHTVPTTTSNVVNKTLRKRHNRFPPLLCPTERIHCSISDLNLTDVTSDIQGLPKEFPLALLYIQELVQEFHREGTELTFSNITNAVTRLFDFLDQIQLAPSIKDWIFALIAELTRVKKDDQFWRPSAPERICRSCTPNRLLLELLLLYDKESEHTPQNQINSIISALNDHVSSSPTSYAHSAKGKQIAPAALMDSISSFISSHQKSSSKTVTEPNFSFYFNSLNDLCLALNDVSEIMVNPYEIIPPCPKTTPSPSTEASPLGTPQRQPSIAGGNVTDSLISMPLTSVALAPPLPPPPSSNKRASIAKQNRKRAFPSKESKFKDINSKVGGGSNNKPGPSGGEKANPKGSSSEDGLVAFAKASEIDWFNNQVVITRVLKDIVWHSSNDTACVDATKVLIGSVLDKIKGGNHLHNRLLVISGAPVNIEGMSVEGSLIRALRGCGGVHGNEMWIAGDSAVVEIRSLAKVNDAYEILKQNKVWYPLEDYVLYPTVSVFRVNDSLKIASPSDPLGEQILSNFLKNKIADPEMPDKLSFKATETLSSIFMSCYSSTIPFEVVEEVKVEHGGEEEEEEEREIFLKEEQLNLKIPGNLLELFISSVKENEDENYLKETLTRFGEKRKRRKRQNQLERDSECKNEKESINPEDGIEKLEQLGLHEQSTSQVQPETELMLSLQGFLEWCTDLMKSQTNLLWKGIFASGYDIRFDRIWLAQDSTLIYNHFHSDKWSFEKDAALISYMDVFAQSLHIDPTRIQPAELSLTESDFLNPSFNSLQDTEIGYLRVRWGMFQKMNTLLSKKLLGHISLHAGNSTRRSLAKLLQDSRQLLLYYTKDMFLYKIIHTSAARGSETPTPEVMLDPVSSIGNQDESAFKNQLSHVIQQMSTITSAFYCVPQAQGADPALPISVKFQGEEVLGLSGSFRHFLLNAAKELQSDTVKLLCRCPSADAGKHKDSFIITPGKLSYGEEDFLYFLGQLVGISLRSDAPLALQLLKVTWRSLLLAEKEENDCSDDLIEADVLCATYLNKLESFATKMAFDNFLSLNSWPKFQYPSMDNNNVVSLCPEGSNISVSFSNRDQFIKLIKQLREKELRSQNRITKILTGLSTIVPLPTILSLFTSDHLELRIAGSPEVNLSLLKSHTHYQVGVSENDPHIMYFWAALDSFTPEELKKFIKFSANLERLPVTCPCQACDQGGEIGGGAHPNSASNSVHVPPFPMKIAPIDIPSSATVDEIDKRLIRVETCLFLIRLPPYSSLQVTRQQLLFAINCREDPLSG